MSANEKIKPTHFQCCTYVYVWQSASTQVQYNRESTDRPYKLTVRGLRLGWSKPQIKIIDQDLARSGSGTSHRHGFAMMPTEVPRNNADGYRLLDLCRVTDTLIGDEDGFSQPALFNDRLLGPSGLALIPRPWSLLSLAVKFFLRDSMGHPRLYRHPPGLDSSSLCRRYLTLVPLDGSRSLIPMVSTDLDMNNFHRSCSHDGRSASATLGSLSHFLHARKVGDSLLRKLDASERAPTLPSKEERKRATSAAPLARSGKIAPGNELLGRPRPPDPSNDCRHTVQADQQGGLPQNSGGLP